MLMAAASPALAGETGQAVGSPDHTLSILVALALFAYAFWPRGQAGAQASRKTAFSFWPTTRGANMTETNRSTTLGRLSLPFRVLYTGFLLAIGLGLLMAGAQIMLTHGMADGKPGLSLNDIVYSYYGNRSGSKLESMLEGQMKAMAPDEVRFELIQWARDDAPREQWVPKIGPLMDKYCVSCHNGQSTLPDFSKMDIARKSAEIDHGASIGMLTRSSHIHLFGISFIFMFVGWIFAYAEFDCRLKVILIATPFTFLILDVLSWWLTKYWPVFAWLTMIGGVGYSVASTIMIFTSLMQMWLPRWTQREAG